MKPNRKFELIALDIDGTLLSDDGHIPAENSRVLKQFAEMRTKGLDSEKSANFTELNAKA